MNTKTLRLTDSAEPQEVFTNALSTKEKKGGKKKRKYDIGYFKSAFPKAGKNRERL